MAFGRVGTELSDRNRSCPRRSRFDVDAMQNQPPRLFQVLLEFNPFPHAPRLRQ